MMSIRHILWLICCLYVSLNAQTISKESNKYKSGDLISKQQIEYLEPGMSGENIIWNFSIVKPIDENYIIRVYTTNLQDSSKISCKEHNTIYRYTQDSDTLFLTGFHNRTTVINYSLPEVIMKFPFRYNDSINSTFKGEGKYCQKVDIQYEGKTNMCCDATGVLILPNMDTVKNVIRIHKVKNYVILRSDSIKVYSDTYQWFSRNYRYPLFESIQSISIKNDSVVEKFSTSFYAISINENIVKNIIESSCKDDVDNVLISCTSFPNPVKDRITINFETSKDANVSFLVCDISGSIRKFIPEQRKNAGKHIQTLDVNELLTGHYILYVKLNDKYHRNNILKL